MGRFLLPSLKAEWNCVGGSGGHFSKSARNAAPPAVSLDVKKTNALYFAVKVAYPPMDGFDVALEGVSGGGNADMLAVAESGGEAGGVAVGLRPRCRADSTKRKR